MIGTELGSGHGSYLLRVAVSLCDTIDAYGFGVFSLGPGEPYWCAG